MTEYVSPAFAGHLIINETRPPNNFGFGTGHINRDWDKHPFGKVGFASPYNGPVLDRNQLRQIIEKKDREKSWMTNLVRNVYNVAPLNQSNTNYCWGNAPVGCVKTKIAMTGALVPDLSAAGVCAPVVRYHNVGGFGGDSLERIRTVGIPTIKFWPLNYWKSAQYDTAECRADAAKHKILDWEETDQGDFLAMATQVVNNNPCFIGIPNWGHEVEVTQILSLPGNKFGIYGKNSWGIYNEDGGYYQCTEAYIRGFDSYATITVSP